MLYLYKTVPKVFELKIKNYELKICEPLVTT
jgi:hypothetical protein